ncbi:hypothetical protein PMIN02_008602 [Paraphaeosphaeria minitans]
MPRWHSSPRHWYILPTEGNVPELDSPKSPLHPTTTAITSTAITSTAITSTAITSTAITPTAITPTSTPTTLSVGLEPASNTSPRAM